MLRFNQVDVMPYSRKVELVNIGDELLLGISENTHLPYICKMLASKGLVVTKNVVIRDHKDEIVDYFSRGWERSDVLITTGGLGPTVDDNTREGIAEALGLKLEYVKEVEQVIESRGIELNDAAKKQCYRPKGFEILYNEYGTAPGLFYQKDGKVLVMLPGPKNELTHMLEKEVFPRLKKVGLLEKGQVWVQLRVFGIPENILDEVLSPVVAKHSGLRISYASHYQLVDIRLSRMNNSISADELRAIADECRNLMGDNFVCFGEQSLAQVVMSQLRDKKLTVAVAESCTGGLLSNEFTNIAGASKVFMGSVVCYVNSAKVELLKVPEVIIEQHGPVSAEAAVALATGAAEQFSSDYGLSTTGFAGPTGGADDNPVGTVYVGFYSPKGVWSCKVSFRGSRQDVNFSAVNAALDYMRRKLNNQNITELLTSVD